MGLYVVYTLMCNMTFSMLIDIMGKAHYNA